MITKRNEAQTAKQNERDEFIAIRREDAQKIDPETAEVTWWFAQTLDPYGISDLSGEERQVGREYYARAPGSDIWVSFRDLPDAVSDALWKKHANKLAFPAGLFSAELRDLVRIAMEGMKRD